MIISLACSSILLSQNVSGFSNYAEKYKDYDIIYLNSKTEVLVDIDKTGLKIEETQFDEIYYNSFKAGAFSERDIQSSHYSELKSVEASTLLPENNKFKEIKVKDFKTKEVFSSDIFYQDLMSTSFIFPSLRQGAITRIKYTLNIYDPHFFPFSILMKNAPVENFEFVINSDKNVEFNFKNFYTDSIQIAYTKEEKGGRVVYTWKARNIPCYKAEANAQNYLCYLPQLIPYIGSYKIKDKEIKVLGNTNDLFKWYSENISRINHKHTDEMTNTVKMLIADCKSDTAKVAAIFHWVQNNIKYVANEYGLGGFIPRDPFQIYEKRYGDCKDMTAIIVELLDIAGIKSYYTWIGSRDLPYKYSEIPTSLVDNHMIATYFENDKPYFLDATNSYIQFGLPTAFIQGKEALIKTDSAKYRIIQVDEVPAIVNLRSDSINIAIENGKLIGKANLKLNGYFFTDLSQSNERLKDTKDKTKFMNIFLEKGNNKFVLDNYKLTTSLNSAQIEYSFNISDYVNTNGNEIYLNLNLSQLLSNYEYFKSDRKLNFEFNFKSVVEETCVFTVPVDYEVMSIPQKSKFENPDFSYEIDYENKGNRIIYHIKTKIDTLLLKPGMFAAWNKMLKQVRADYKESIVLKKKN